MALTPGGVSTDNTTASMLQDDQIEDAIHEADSIINTYVATGYAVPVVDIEVVTPGEGGAADTTATISVGKGPFRWWSRDIAAYLTTLTYRRNKDITEDDPIRLRFALVMRMLEGIKSGDTTIPVDDNENPGSSEQDVFPYPYYEGQLFDPKSMGLVESHSWLPPHHMYSGRLW